MGGTVTKMWDKALSVLLYATNRQSAHARQGPAQTPPTSAELVPPTLIAPSTQVRQEQRLQEAPQLCSHTCLLVTLSLCRYGPVTHLEMLQWARRDRD